MGKRERVEVKSCMKMAITYYMTFPCNVALSFAHKQEERSMIESVWEREREWR